MPRPQNRFLELDYLRGLAVLGMILFHAAFDLNYFGVTSLGVSRGLWWFLARAVASTFIFLVGISLTISYSRRKSRGERAFIKHLFLRGAKIFAWGLTITFITWLLLPEGTIFFGVLHFIGASIILAYPFIRRPDWAFITGILTVLFAVLLAAEPFGLAGLVWLGLTPAEVYTLDYFPIIPWFSLILFGIVTGNVFYPEGKSKLKFKLKDNMLALLGRNALLVYLIHQPVLIFVLWILGADIIIL